MSSSSTIAAEPQVDRTAPAPRSRKTRDPLFGINGNTKRGRRVRDLAREFFRRLGDRAADPLWQAAAVEAAEFKELVEHALAESRATGKIDHDQLVRLKNLASRAERWLGLEVERKQEPMPVLSRLKLLEEDGA
jgi:hypothetical protein